MAGTFAAARLDSHCIPTKRRRFADQSSVAVSYAAAMSDSDDVNVSGAILGHANSAQLVERRTWTR
jgi:hypothetical protein